VASIPQLRPVTPFKVSLFTYVSDGPLPAIAIDDSIEVHGQMRILLVEFCLVLATTALCAQSVTRTTTSPQKAHVDDHPELENDYLKIRILPGWKIATAADPILNLAKDRYVLSVNPIFTHASGVIGGRFSEITSGKQSIDAVMANVDQPAGGFECAQWPTEELIVTRSIVLRYLYTDRSKTGNGCAFPSRPHPVWFGSYFSGEGSETDYYITLTYSTDDVNVLPRKWPLELTGVFTEVAEMLRTLELKPPVTISRIDPQSAPPGSTVTIYRNGFNLLNQAPEVRFSEFPNNPMAAPVVAADGKSLTFEVPTSTNMISCPAGRIDVNEWCVPIPANHVDVSDCPPRPDGSDNFRGVPMTAATYHISVTLGGGINSNPVPFTVSTPTPNPVSISLLHPNYLVSQGDTVTCEEAASLRPTTPCRSARLKSQVSLHPTEKPLHSEHQRQMEAPSFVVFKFTRLGSSTTTGAVT
jgi:hypothetical protein